LQLRKLAPDLVEPCRHVGVLLQRQRHARAKKGIALRAKPGKARAPLDLSGILRGAPLDLRPLFERFCEEAIGPAVAAAVTAPRYV